MKLESEGAAEIMGDVNQLVGVRGPSTSAKVSSFFATTVKRYKMHAGFPYHATERDSELSEVAATNCDCNPCTGNQSPRTTQTCRNQSQT